MKQTFFITGTDTDVGKTIISLALCVGLQRRMAAATYWKPIQTGNANGDAAFIERIVDHTVTIAPTIFSYPTPRAPDQAAIFDRLPEASVAKVLESYAALTGDQALVVEGAGGLLVPLNQQNETWSSLLAQMRWHTILVARTNLGTINHTSLTLEHLKSIGQPPLAVVMNGKTDVANLQSLERLYPSMRFLSFPLVDLSNAEAFAREAEQLASAVINLAIPRDNSGEHIARIDAGHVWHPYTQHKTAPQPMVITRAQGSWLYTSDGERLFDATGSWWVNTIGHGRKEIADAIAMQQQTLDHILFAGATHEPAALLAKTICAKTDDQFSKVYFSDNGSTAIEIAIKMAFQSFTNVHKSGRHKFISLKGSYHGDTIACMALGGGDGFDDPYKPLLFNAHKIAPVTSHPSRYTEASAEASIEQLAKHLEVHHQDYAAFIAEPLLQGAGGMLMHDATWLKKICELVRRFDIPVIFDEVFTGMGRTGSWFAYQKLGFTPDIMCLAKGLTGGTLPLALTLTNDAIFASFLSDDKSHALLHGHSFTGNPIACQAALASLAIYDQEDLCARAADMECVYKEWMASHALSLGLLAPRCLGAVMAFELPGSGVGRYFHPAALGLHERAKSHGLFLRPLGNTLYFAPPFTTSNVDLRNALGTLSLVLLSANKV